MERLGLQFPVSEFEPQIPDSTTFVGNWEFQRHGISRGLGLQFRNSGISDSKSAPALSPHPSCIAGIMAHHLGMAFGLPSGEPSPGPKGCFPTAILSPRSKTRWSCCGASLGQGESARWVAGASCAGCSTSSRHLRAESCPAAPRPHRPRAHLHSKTAESPRVVERRRAERRVGCRRRRPNRLPLPLPLPESPSRIPFPFPNRHPLPRPALGCRAA
jgi:hypothetical protein